MIVDVMLLFV